MSNAGNAHKAIAIFGVSALTMPVTVDVLIAIILGQYTSVLYNTHRSDRISIERNGPSTNRCRYHLVFSGYSKDLSEHSTREIRLFDHRLIYNYFKQSKTKRLRHCCFYFFCYCGNW